MSENGAKSYDDLKRKRRMSKMSWAFTYSIIAGLFIAVVVFSLVNRVDYFIGSAQFDNHIIKVVVRVDGDNEAAGEEAFLKFGEITDKYAYTGNSPLEKLNEKRMLKREEDEKTFELLGEILDCAKITEGLFDPTFSIEDSENENYDETVFKNGYYKIYMDDYEIRLQDDVEIHAADLIPYFAMDEVQEYLKNKYGNVSGYIRYDEDFLVFGPKFNTADWTIPILQPDEELTYSDETMLLLYVPKGAVMRKAEPVPSPVDGRTYVPEYHSISLLSQNALKSKCLMKAVQVSPVEYAVSKSSEWGCEFLIFRTPDDRSYTNGIAKYLMNK